MNKTVLAILLGGLCASCWWAAARWASFNNGILFAPAAFTSVAVVVWIVWESFEVNNIGK